MNPDSTDRSRANEQARRAWDQNAEFWDLRMSPDMVGSEAQFDIPLVPEVRRYYMPSTSHGGGGGGFSPNLTGVTFGTTGQCSLPANPNPTATPVRDLSILQSNRDPLGSASKSPLKTRFVSGYPELRPAA